MPIAEQTRDKRRSLLLITALVAYTFYTLARTVPQIAYYWLPQGDFGIRDIHLTGTIEQISPHSAASDAGLRVGDRIDMRYVSLHQLIVAQGQARVGEVWPLRVLQTGKYRLITLVARPVYLGSARVRDDVISQITGLLRVLLGVIVVLLKPGRLTWLFYLSMTAGGYYTDLFATFPGWLTILAILPYTALAGAAPFILAIFCLVFPHDQLTGWRRRIFPFVVGAAIAAAAFELVQLAAFVLRNNLAENTWIGFVEDITGGLVASSALIAYFFESTRPERSRVGWLITLFVIGYILEATLDLHNILLPGVPMSERFLIFFWVYELLLTFAFAYSIIRNGMFDIEFVLSRGVVYGLLVLVGLALFAGFDITTSALFHGSKVEVAIDVAVATALGFGARGAYGRLTDFVDRTFFRRRYEARIRLKAALDALAAANSPHAIEKILTDGAASAFDLASAVFFRRLPDGGLLREHGIGWPPDALWHLLSDDELVEVLEHNAPRAIDLQAMGWSDASLVSAHRPVLAIPMVSSGDLIGVTLYGSRLDGVLPSPDTTSGLVELARRAAFSYRAVDSSLTGAVAADLAAARSSI